MRNTLTQLKMFAWTVLLEARSSRVIISAIVIFSTALTLSFFVGEITITETQQTQAAITAAFLRIAIIFFLSLFTINSILRDINDRMLLLYFSLPISRPVFVLGKFIGFACLATLFCLMASALLSLYSNNFELAFLWGFSLLMESWLIIAFSLLCSFSLGQVTTAFAAVMGIYLLSRSITAIILMAHNPLKVYSDSVSQQFIQGFISVLDYLLPRLDRFTRTDWLMYGTVSTEEINFILQQTIVYLCLLLAAAFLDFYRKNI